MEAYLNHAPSGKLGVKYLDSKQLSNSFPDWKALLSRIEEQRDVAAFVRNLPLQDPDNHLPQTYDNVYAILGGRGTGKSSVVLTLRHKMSFPENQDILLPIITPEVISEKDCSILGWVMSATESVLDRLEARMKRVCDCDAGCGTACSPSFFDGFFKDCQFQKENPLRKSYRELFKKSVRSSGDLNFSSFSPEDATALHAQQSRRQYKLIQDLNGFWRQLTECWYQTNCRLERAKGAGDVRHVKRPLIILIFDDIDLVPERSMELLSTTFQYFTNPNIVILLTAAERMLQEVIRLRMLELLVGSNYPSLLLEGFPKTKQREDVNRTSKNGQ